ncbi:MAG: DNA polymerase III subunit beta [Brevinema sp.]
MKFHVNKDEFLKALITADSIINPRTPLSILLNIYLEVHNDGQMIIQSYNGDHGVKVESSVDVQEAGRISLLSKKLLDIVRNIPGDRISIEQIEGSLETIIRPEGKKTPTFRLHGVSVDTYPTFKEVNWENYLKLNQETLKGLIEATEFAVSTDQAQIAFTGTFITESAEGILSFVSTDGKRLAVISKSIEDKKGQVPMDIIVPQKIMKTVSDTLNKGEVLFSVHDGQAYFKIDNVYIFTNLVEGKFPNYRDVIPAQSASVIEVDAAGLSSCLQRVAIMSDNESGRVKLQVENGQFIVSGSNMQGEGSDSIELDKVTEGEIATVAINHKSLTEFLKILQGKKVLISINSSGSPILLRPAGENDYEYIIMPMKV